MNKIYKILLLFFFVTFSFSSNSHVQHYKDLNSIEFDIYRNNKFIGTHIFTFKDLTDELHVKSKINFQIKKFGVVLYKYYAEGTEVYKDKKLISFNSKTKQNKKDKYVNIEIIGAEYKIDGSSFKGTAPTNFLIGTWWNHSLVEAPAQISAVSGRIIMQKVEFLGREKLNLNEKNYNTLHFNFSSTDKKLGKNKKLNTDVWYEEGTLNWIKAAFNKKGKWEYRLKTIK